MKVIIAGSRTITDYAIVVAAIKASGFEITEVVSGGAWGVDSLGEKWAYENGINKRVFMANWKTDGKRAGPIRNQRMSEYANALIAVWDGLSPGTRDMIARAEKLGLKVYIHPAK